MGDTAKPGNDTIAETDQMATSAMTDIVPLPVFTLIAYTILSVASKSCAKKQRWRI